MTARERLAALLADTCDQLVHRQADAILKALRLTDAAALALMEGDAVATPKQPDGKALSMVAKFVRDRAIPSPTNDDPDAVYFDNGHARELYRIALAASPYKDNFDAE